jgi:hypothetical protein
VVGAAFGGGGYLLSVATGQEKFNLRRFAGATIGGAVGGAVAGACGGVAVWALATCGAVGGVLEGKLIRIAKTWFKPSKLSNIWSPESQHGWHCKPLPPSLRGRGCVLDCC